MTQCLPPQIADEVRGTAEEWSRSGKTARLWNHDKTPWTNADEDKWLGDVAERQLEQKQIFDSIANQAKSGGYSDAVVLGMGGSSNAFQLQGTTAVELLRSHLNRLCAGDYFALLGYIQMNASHEKDLQKMRLDVRNKKHVATCLGFGPRFPHSTGQAYKGGPNSGVFLQITCDDAHDIPIPGQKFTFGTVKAAQARSDFDVLAERQRRALRVHLPADLKMGLATLEAAITEALK
jgi:hypothetical protein